jgi:hypothetical protein
MCAALPYAVHMKSRRVSIYVHQVTPCSLMRLGAFSNQRGSCSVLSLFSLNACCVSTPRDFRTKGIISRCWLIELFTNEASIKVMKMMKMMRIMNPSEWIELPRSRESMNNAIVLGGESLIKRAIRSRRTN